MIKKGQKLAKKVSKISKLDNFKVVGFTGRVLTPDIAFVCLAMFNTVRLSMTLFFPFAISMSGEARVSVNRYGSIKE